MDADALYEQWRRGDFKAAQKLAEALYDAVPSWLCAAFRLDHRHELHELTQECVVHIFRKMERFHRQCPFMGWAHTLAINRTRDLLRKSGRIPPTVSLDQPLGHEDDSAVLQDVLAGRDPAIRDHVDRSLVRVAAIKAKTRLTNVRYRRAIELRFERGLDMDDVAEALKVTPDQAHLIVFRALAALVKVMKGMGF